MPQKTRVSSGVTQLDRLLDGVFIGDNVVWHDDAGNLAYIFCLNFIKTSIAQHKPVIYVSFDRSPKNLLEKLGSLADSDKLIILDAFTCGKGASSPVFMKFYDGIPERPCRIERIDRPLDMDHVMEILYGLHSTLQGDVRLVFESITGMQEIWGGEEAILRFYSHSCPRLYELDTIAYWIMEKLAHSARLKAQINQIAQVAIDLSIRRGTTTLTILKAENRGTEGVHQPFRYWAKNLAITFDTEKHGPAELNLGNRVKDLRTKRGLSQADLARLIGVTPSTISQVEANAIYPSVPALLKIAEVLAVSLGSLFQSTISSRKNILFSPSDAAPASFGSLPSDSIEGKLLVPVDFDGKMEPYLIEIAPGTELPSHFFSHKGEEMGYLVSGRLETKIERITYILQPGDTIYLTSELPAGWTNPGPETAKLLWIKAR